MWLQNVFGIFAMTVVVQPHDYLVFFPSKKFFSATCSLTQDKSFFLNVNFLSIWLKIKTKLTPALYFICFHLPRCLQDPSRRRSSHRFRLLVPRGCPHYWGSSDTSISLVQRRWQPGWRQHAGGHKAPGGHSSSLNDQIVYLFTSCLLKSGCKGLIKTVTRAYFFSISALMHVQFMLFLVVLNQTDAFIWHKQ